ncbi:MAG: recombinase family protein [Polyangiaceae bacterium]|jgi:hypothetical protein|nr:recombinase family protein [Polyangiaceae bacterium]
MRAAVYARFSSENQREQGIDDQIRVCREFAKRDGITILEEHIYFDEAQSGSIRARPGLEALKRAAEDKQFDAVLVDDSSRLSRDNQHFNTLESDFHFALSAGADYECVSRVFRPLPLAPPGLVACSSPFVPGETSRSAENKLNGRSPGSAVLREAENETPSKVPLGGRDATGRRLLVRR